MALVEMLTLKAIVEASIINLDITSIVNVSRQALGRLIDLRVPM